MGELRFGVLGPVEVLRDGRPVALGGRPSVNLLAGLMLSANQPVSYDRLIAIVWGSRLPDHPQAALQSLKSRLQRVLGGAAIQTAANGYRLAVGDDALDLLRFERLIGEAAEAAGDAADPGQEEPGDEEAAARAVAAIDRALGLWDPPVLANVHSDVLLREGVGYLTERYLSAQEKRAALQLRLGRHRAMIPELGRLVAAHPALTPASRCSGCTWRSCAVMPGLTRPPRSPPRPRGGCARQRTWPRGCRASRRRILATSQATASTWRPSSRPSPRRWPRRPLSPGSSSWPAPAGSASPRWPSALPTS